MESQTNLDHIGQISASQCPNCKNLEFQVGDPTKELIEQGGLRVLSDTLSRLIKSEEDGTTVIIPSHLYELDPDIVTDVGGINHRNLSDDCEIDAFDKGGYATLMPNYKHPPKPYSSCSGIPIIKWIN
ncbi:hypothetical protein K8R47_00035 [archaeon]|nr:hypothetical protein [archaeon]